MSDYPWSAEKVVLTKASPTVSLTKTGSADGVLRVNLNWNTDPGGTGGKRGRKRATGGVDLDLGCLYDYTDGSTGVVQAIGKNFRDQHSFGPDPICRLDGDDRSGSSVTGENLFVDLRQAAHVRRILVFAFIYEGMPNWAAADGVVTLHPAAGQRVAVPLDDASGAGRMCGIVLLTNDGDDVRVSREVRYVPGHEALDRAYGWGMSWGPGSK